MTGWLEVLTDAWDELLQVSPVARQYRTKLLSTDIPLDILAAIRAVDNAPCLLVHAEGLPDDLFELGGMRLDIVTDESGPALVLSLETSSRRDLFSTICADVVGAASVATGQDIMGQFLARLNAWRRFLRERHTGLSRIDTIGLIGELLVLEKVVSVDPDAQTSWEAPDDGLHDFQQYGHAIEVKTSLGPASVVRISSLDQLETAGLRRLELFHVRLIETPGGRSLGTLITDIAEMLPDEAARQSFENSLLKRGLMPDDAAARTQPQFQLRDMAGYTVSEEFPRLMRSKVPSAVLDAEYTLDLRSISGMSVDAVEIIKEFCKRGPV